MTEELRTIELNGVAIGQVQERWQQTDPYTWTHQWDLVGGTVCFDTFEEAAAYVHGRYEGAHIGPPQTPQATAKSEVSNLHTGSNG